MWVKISLLRGICLRFRCAMYKTLQKYFGYTSFYPLQEDIINEALGQRDVFVLMPTGGGKSLCYQLPGLLLDGLTVVISPLIALMKDQLDFLVSRGVAGGGGGGGVGGLKLLYVSPERLGNERFLRSLGRRKIALLAVDEAHCISEWGHNFRPDYLKIARLARQLKVERVLALTATATPEVAHDIAEGFGIAAADVVHTGFYRPNLRL